MNKKYFLFILLLLLLMGWTSCTYERNTTVSNVQEISQGAQWTLMYYGPGDNELDTFGPEQSYTQFNVAQLEQVSSTDLVNVVALTKSRIDNSPHAKYQRITFHPGNGIQSETTEWQNTNLSDPATLLRFIQETAQRYPAQYYAMVVTGGGSGWRGVCEEENTQMFIRQFGNAFIQSGVRFEVVALLVPETGMIEVGYELHEAVNYLIVPSYRSSPAPYFSGRRWFQDLVSQPYSNGERIGKLMVDAFHQAAMERRDTTLFVMVQLSNLSMLGNEINQLAEHLQGIVPTSSQELFALRRACWQRQFDDSSNVDILKFIKNLLRNNNLLQQDSEIETHCRNIVNLLLQTNVYQRPNSLDRFAITPSYYDPDRGGISVYFPAIAGPVLELPVYTTTRFASEQNNWPNFVNYFNTYELMNGIVVTGTVKLIQRPLGGNTFQPLYLFIDTTTQQRPQPFHTIRLPIQVSDLRQLADTTYADFTARFTLDPSVTSVRARLFVFQDMDRNELFNGGDRYGFHYSQSRFRPDTLRIAPGDSIRNTRYVLSWTYQ
ncbi:MAG: clostripain-related cysteine peptidase [bacterium]|nr:clostripain-related cysteine peptidase [bacterium]